MKLQTKKHALWAALILAISLAAWKPILLHAQVYSGLGPRDTQRNALQTVVGQVNWVRNTARTAPSYLTDAFEMVWSSFQALRAHYTAFRSTLTPDQLARGANEIADLDAGLDIIQEAFADYQQQVAVGQGGRFAFARFCRVVDEATGIWGRELQKNSQRLRVGW
jgi:hypothetical protein